MPGPTPRTGYRSARGNYRPPLNAYGEIDDSRWPVRVIAAAGGIALAVLVVVLL